MPKMALKILGYCNDTLQLTPLHILHKLITHYTQRNLSIWGCRGKSIYLGLLLWDSSKTLGMCFDMEAKSTEIMFLFARA